MKKQTLNGAWTLTIPGSAFPEIKAALDAAGTAEVTSKRSFNVRANYSDYQKLNSLLATCGADVQTPVFDADVSFVFSVPSENADSLLTKIADTTCGRASVEETE